MARVMKGIIIELFKILPIFRIKTKLLKRKTESACTRFFLFRLNVSMLFVVTLLSIFFLQFLFFSCSENRNVESESNQTSLCRVCM